ncbi:DNA-binding response regulator [Altericroceibacterium spongiae]|uniref:DNA-binding response regulator n=1 Tax=Altericroceibacterium spongiae TaxID=2320269 RepID=A0A420EQS7_9SPHN|nr:response regulator transcription factor [Altericroceibacterium spongiae]RKF23024.1 DNA-binding response regulator [Altericroceibacterium spongiae]
MNLHSTSTGNILVVDDDPDIRELIMEQLRRESYTVRSASSVQETRDQLAAHPADVVVLDLNLPDGDGLTLCRELRADGFADAVIMVTARDSAIDRVLGLELGADDYLTKPFEPRELTARIRNLFRRMSGGEDGRPRNARFALFGSWKLDLLQRRLVTEDDRLVMLSSSEFRLLNRFIESPKEVLSREMLLPERAATVAFDRSIDLQVSRLRQKLTSEPGGADLIVTIRSEGYLFATDVRFE